MVESCVPSLAQLNRVPSYPGAELCGAHCKCNGCLAAYTRCPDFKIIARDIPNKLNG